MPATSLFVTGTGTDVGKTFVTVALIAALRARGLAVRAVKPVASGFDAGAPAGTDSGRLALALGLPLNEPQLAAVSPWRFAAPLSPDMAAAREGRRIDFERLLRFSAAAAGADVTLIEGIGGVMVPLDEQHTVLDWIAALGAPALLVAGSYLGTLSHTLSAAGMLAARGCRLAGVVVSESAEQPVPPDETAAVLRRFLAPTPVALLARQRPEEAAASPALMHLIEHWGLTKGSEPFVEE
jgi:dethiobiotin synthetase